MIGRDDAAAAVEKPRAVPLTRAADEHDGGGHPPVEILVAERVHRGLARGGHLHDHPLGGVFDPLGELVLPAPAEVLAQGREVVAREAARDHAQDEHDRQHDAAPEQLPEPPVEQDRQQDRDVERPADDDGGLLRHLDGLPQEQVIAVGKGEGHAGQHGAQEEQRPPAEGLPEPAVEQHGEQERNEKKRRDDDHPGPIQDRDPRGPCPKGGPAQTLSALFREN